MLATTLFLLAPAAGRWMKSGYEAVAYTSLITGLITAFFGSLVSPLWASFGFVVETAILLGLAHRFRQVPWLVAALVSGHVAVFLALTGQTWPAQSPIPVIAWGVLATTLFLLAPAAGRWMKWGYEAVAYSSLITGLITAFFGSLVSPLWASFGVVVETALLLGMAHRFRQVAWLAAALVSGHVAVYLALMGQTLPDQSPIPVIVWGVLAGALFLLAPAAGRWMKWGYETVAYTSLITGLITAFFGILVSPLWASFGVVVETAILLGMAHRFRKVAWLAAALVSGHVAVYLALLGQTLPDQSPIPVIVWGVLATGLFLLAPAAGRWMKWGYEAVAYTSLITGLLAMGTGGTISVASFALAAVIETLLLVGTAHRQRHVGWLIGALMAGHIAVASFLAALSLPLNSPLYAVVWSALAVLFFALAPRAEQWIRDADATLMYGSLITAGIGVMAALGLIGVWLGVTLAVECLLMLAATYRNRHALMLVGAIVTGHAALGAFMAHWSVPFYSLRSLATWLVVALALYAIAPRAGRWLRRGYSTVAYSSLLTFGLALVAVVAFSRLWQAGLLVVLMALVGGIAWRRRQGAALLAAIAVGHTALLAVLIWLGRPSSSGVPLSIVWLALATLWLTLSYRADLPRWICRMVSLAFAVESAWALLYGLQGGYAMMLVGATLMGLWLWWGYRRESTLSIPLANALLLYAVVGMGRAVSQPILPTLTMAIVSAVAALLAPTLPPYARHATRRSSQFLGVAAGLAGLVVTRSIADSYWQAVAESGAIALAVGGVLHLAVAARQRDRIMAAFGGSILYLGYAWLLVQHGYRDIQLYTAAAALLFFGYSVLFEKERTRFERVAVALLLLPAFGQMLNPQFLYSGLVILWGLLLLGGGIALDRRLLIVAGSTALLLGALRQLWAVITVLPPGLAIGLVGLLLMASAVILTLRRDALMRMLRGD